MSSQRMVYVFFFVLATFLRLFFPFSAGRGFPFPLPGILEFPATSLSPHLAPFFSRLLCNVSPLGSFSSGVFMFRRLSPSSHTFFPHFFMVPHLLKYKARQPVDPGASVGPFFAPSPHVTSPAGSSARRSHSRKTSMRSLFPPPFTFSPQPFPSLLHFRGTTDLSPKPQFAPTPPRRARLYSTLLTHMRPTPASSLLSDQRPSSISLSLPFTFSLQLFEFSDAFSIGPTGPNSRCPRFD